MRRERCSIDDASGDADDGAAPRQSVVPLGQRVACPGLSGQARAR
jgi:hypothetical protein